MIDNNAPGKEDSITSKNIPSTNYLEGIDLRLEDKKMNDQFKNIKSLDGLVGFLNNLKDRALSSQQKEKLGIAISAVQEIDANIKTAIENYSNNSVDFLNEGDIFAPINRISTYDVALSQKIKDILIENDFTAKYLGLKFLPGSPSASKWLTNLKQQLASYEQELNALKKQDQWKFKKIIEHLEQERRKTAHFIEYAEEMKGTDKEVAEEELKSRIPELLALAKQIQKFRGETIDLKGCLNEEEKEDLHSEINELISKKYTLFIDDDYAEDEGISFEAEDDISEMGFRQLKKFNKKLALSSGFNLYLEKDILPIIMQEIDLFFDNYPEEKNKYPTLVTFYEKLLQIKTASEEEVKKQALAGQTEIEKSLTEEGNTILNNPIAPTSPEALKNNSRFKNFLIDARDTSKDGFLSLLSVSGSYMLSRILEAPLDFIFFFSEPRLTEKGFNWKGIEEVIFGEKGGSKGPKQ